MRLHDLHRADARHPEAPAPDLDDDAPPVAEPDAVRS
jgi:hypothetical protein